MLETSSHTPQTPSIGLAPRADAESVGLACNEVWGGNHSFFGPIELPGVQGVLFSQPCEGSRGGDVHYLSVCGSGLISRACLAYVMGHGESVAAVSQFMHELLRRSVNRMDERRVLRRLNLRLSELGDGALTTASMLTYFPPTHRLSISYAGHEPAWYYEASRQHWTRLDRVEKRGLFDIVLAAEPKARYTRRVRKTAAGDRLLMITDGVLEAPNATGELFGRERVANVLQAAHDRSTQALVKAIIEELGKHTNETPLHHDDVSILMLEFVDNLKGSALRTVLRNRLFGRWRKDKAFNA